MRIAIIVGSIREGRHGSSVGRWVHWLAEEHAQDDQSFHLLELADFDVPLLTDAVVPGAANRQYSSPEIRRWGQEIDSYDGFVWITPEYNHGVPGAFKNAFDAIYPEWMHKAVGFVSYGADSGVRAVEQWRQIVVNAQMVDVRAQVALNSFTDFDDDGFAPQERRPDELRNMLTQLTTMTEALQPLRS